MFGIHPGFLIVLLIIVLIVFGPGKLPEIGGAIGRGIREFRRESDKIVEEVRSATTASEAEKEPAKSEAARTEPEKKS